MNTTLSIIIPAFNEEERIANTLFEYHEYLSNNELDFEIVVVDDGSSDGTVAKVNQLKQVLPYVSIVESKPNRGKGFAVRIGMLLAKGQFRCMVDADCSMHPDQLKKLLEPVMTGKANIAIGSRYLKGSSTDGRQPMWRVGWSRLANFFVRATLLPGIKDTQCGFKVFTAASAESIFKLATIDGWSFDLEALAIAMQQGLTIKEVPIHWTDDGRTRVSAASDFFKVIAEWIKIIRLPKSKWTLES